VKYLVQVGGRQIEVATGSGGLTVDGSLQEALLLPSAQTHRAELRIGSRIYDLTFRDASGSGRGRARYTIWVNGERFEVNAMTERALAIEKLSASSSVPHHAASVFAPMPGMIVRISVLEGETVTAGQGLVVMEAMKMENELRASAAGVVRRVHVEAGRAVEKGTLLVELE
jgi:pyruvate carboxylase subunit B